MDRWIKVGSVLLLTGLVLLASAAAGMGRRVVAEDEAYTHLNLQTLGPFDLPGGDYTIWLEDHPAWPEGIWEYEVFLRGDGDELQGVKPGNRKPGDIEGVPCFMLAKFSDVPEGEWSLAIRLWTGGRTDVQDEVWVFILSSPGTFEIVALTLGVVMAVTGATTVAMRKWPGKRE